MILMNIIIRNGKMDLLGFLSSMRIRYLKNKGWLNFRMRAMITSFASYQLWLDWKSNV